MNNKSTHKAIVAFSQLSFTIIGCVFTGVFLGKYLDQFFGTSPWLLVFCSLAGAGAAMRSMYTYISKVQ